LTGKQGVSRIITELVSGLLESCIEVANDVKVRV
jgi:hypothetical protein